MKKEAEIAELIRGLAKERNVAISKMLKESGAGERLVSNLERGSMPSADKIFKLAAYLGVSAEYLMFGEEVSAKISIGDVSNSNGVGQVNAPITVVGVAGSKESAELLRIFEGLPFKLRLELLNKAVELEDKNKNTEEIK